MKTCFFIGHHDASDEILDTLIAVDAPGAGEEGRCDGGSEASEPMKWVGLMNTCKAQAEEIILDEQIYIIVERTENGKSATYNLHIIILFLLLRPLTGLL